MFISSSWGGRVSDKQIANDSILADRGFNVKAELAVKGAVFKIPNPMLLILLSSFEIRNGS